MSDDASLGGWRTRLEQGQTGVVLADAHHPLEVYLGADDLSRPLVQIRSAAEPHLAEFSQLVRIDHGKDGSHWVLTLTLMDTHFTEVFIRLVAHLIAASRSESTPPRAWLAARDVLDEWRRLLRARPLGLLSTEELRGMVGESWLLLNRFAPELGVGSAIAGWLGPLAAPQDFWYPSTGFHEAKSIGPTATGIKVSSAHQLDEADMELLVLQVPQVSKEEVGAVSLAGLIGAVASAIENAGIDPAELDTRLRQVGVEIDDPYYAETWFRVQAVESFRVTIDFPAVRHSTLPQGIERVRYTLDRAAIAPFLVSTDRY